MSMNAERLRNPEYNAEATCKKGCGYTIRTKAFNQKVADDLAKMGIAFHQVATCPNRFKKKSK